MKTFAIAAVALGAILIQGTPVAQAQNCEQRVDELERRVRELEAQFAGLSDGSGNAETRRTTTGAVFTRVTRSGFGESWRDPSGMIWGDIAQNANGWARSMDQYQATEYCQSLGAQLPSRADFARLRGYMGATTATSENAGTGYTPQVLPHLTRQVDGRPWSNFFWSSFHPDYSGFAYGFGGRVGVIGVRDRAYEYAGRVRCVARR